MKKSIKMFLISLCLCPLLLLTACGTTSYYTITVSPSDSVLGSVLGTLSDSTQVEGTTVTLTAKENSAQTNPFICWIKNNNTVVSTDTALTLTYNSETAGRYTALFDETNPNSMMYAAFDTITFEPIADVTEINFTLSYSRTASGNDVYTTLARGSLSTENTYTSDHTSVLYLGSVGTISSYQYRFRLNITLVDSNGAETSYSLTSQAILNNSSFNSTRDYEITIYDSNSDSDIVLSFVKLSKELFSSADTQLL